MRKALQSVGLLGRAKATKAEGREPPADDNSSERDIDMAEKPEDSVTETPETGASAAAEDETPDAGATVVDLDAARAAAKGETLAYVREVTDLCALAGRPDMAAGFIEKETAVANVRSALLAQRAAQADADSISGQISPEDKGDHGWGEITAKLNKQMGFAN